MSTATITLTTVGLGTFTCTQTGWYTIRVVSGGGSSGGYGVSVVNNQPILLISGQEYSYVVTGVDDGSIYSGSLWNPGGFPLDGQLSAQKGHGGSSGGATNSGGFDCTVAQVTGSESWNTGPWGTPGHQGAILLSWNPGQVVRAFNALGEMGLGGADPDPGSVTLPACTAKIECWSAGGDGANGSGSGGQGGGGGCYTEATETLAAGTYSYNVGVGGGGTGDV